MGAAELAAPAGEVLVTEPASGVVAPLRNPSGEGAACEACGARLVPRSTGRPGRFCSSWCRQRAYRRRGGDPTGLVAAAPFWSGEGAVLHAGDAAAVLELMPTGSVQCVVTSPPYYGLRDYGGQRGQLGREATPELYVDALGAVFAQLARVLRPDGTVWLNLGDTYAGRANAGVNTTRGHSRRTGVLPPRVRTTAAAPYKSLLGMPWRVALALQDAGWAVRNDVVWHKPNAMPESATDRLSARYEHLFLLARSPRYYFDLEAIKIEASHRSSGSRDKHAYAAAVGTGRPARRFGANPTSTLASKVFDTRNPGDVWSLATRPSTDPHFAMFPVDLPLRCVAASTRPGDVVLDPFVGAGTTARAARALQRRFVGIDLNPAYLELTARHLS